MDERSRRLKGKVLSGRVCPEFFPIEGDEVVVNLGCGDGPQAIIYAGHYKEMIGVDINKRRLERSKEAVRLYGVRSYTTICGDVEHVPLRKSRFDKAIAIDIIEHIQNPRELCLEANRLLKEGGELFITFPAMHDKFTGFISKLGRLILRRKRGSEGPVHKWNPDAHNQDYPLSRWIAIVEGCGFRLSKSRASTLFPPLHLYGVPRFWFSNDTIHKIDSSCVRCRC